MSIGLTLNLFYSKNPHKLVFELQTGFDKLTYQTSVTPGKDLLRFTVPHGINSNKRPEVMKNYLLAALISLAFLSSCEPDRKVNVCHKGKIIRINIHALPAHQGHADAVDMDNDGYYTGDNACSEPDCDDTDGTVNPGANNCTKDTCSITLLEVLNATCLDPDPNYGLQLRVTYNNPPAAGTLDVTIDGALSSFAITGSPQTVNIWALPRTGEDVAVSASFSDDPACVYFDEDLYQAPDCGL